MILEKKKNFLSYQTLKLSENVILKYLSQLEFNGRIKSKKNYECLSLLTKRQMIMSNEKRKACQFIGKEKKSFMKFQRFWCDCLMCIFL